MLTSRLTFVAIQLNGALGSGRFDDVTIEQVRQHLREGTIWVFLKKRLGIDLDVGILEPVELLELETEWADMELCIDHARKLCVDKNGLCLLVAYLLEGIQRRHADIIDQRIRSGLPLIEENFPAELPDHLNKWKKFFAEPEDEETTEDTPTPHGSQDDVDPESL